MHFCGGGGQALHLQGLQIPMGSLRSPAGLSTPFSEPLTDSRVHGLPWFTDRWELLLNLPPVNSFRTPWQPCHTSRSWGSIWRLMTHIWAIWTLLKLKMCAAVGIVEARCSADNPLWRIWSCLKWLSQEVACWEPGAVFQNGCLSLTLK